MIKPTTWTPAALLAALASIAAPPAAEAQLSAIPSAAYFDIRAAYEDGDAAGALRSMRSVIAGNLAGRSPLELICYHSLAGECFYQMGDLPGAMEQYTAALRAWQTASNWMLHCAFPAEQLLPDETVPRPPIAWSGRTRRVLRARLPGHFFISVGGLANFARNADTGGLAIVQQSAQRRVEGLEILRCTALALRRRAELLGPLAQHDPMTDGILNAFGQPMAPPNHYSTAWVRLLGGLAQVAAGRDQEAAIELNASLTIGGMDHPLTCVGLLELGKIAHRQGALEQAQRLLLEATFSAAEHQQWQPLGEAFHRGMLVHLQRGERSVWAPLAAAAPWSRRVTRLLTLSTTASLAENMAAVGASADALALVERGRRDVGRRSIAQGAISARLLYQQALAGYQLAQGPAADQALAAAMPMLIQSSRWNYQTALADSLHARGAIGGRAAAALYDELLRDPRAEDWLRAPHEALAALLAPNEAAMEHWFELALNRKEWQRAMEISDLIRRRRFYRSLPLGGRLLALRWIAAAPEPLLTAEAIQQRQHLANTRPQFAQVAKQAAAVRQQLRPLPLQPADDESTAKQKELLGSLAELSARQELMLRAMALDRVPSELVFPPRLDAERLQQRLGEKQALLSYFATSKQVYGLALTRQGYAMWVVAAPRNVRAELTALLKSIGSVKGNAKLPADRIADDSWKKIARQLRDELLPKPSETDTEADREMWRAVEELVIVPDSVLWYVPFELLPDSAEEGDDTLLVDRKQVRYVPLVSLAFGTSLPRPVDVRTAVVAQRVQPEDTVEQARAEAERLAAAGGVVGIWENSLPASSALLSAISEQMIVWSNLPDTPPRAPHAWSPMLLDRGKPGSTVGAWLELPWGGPREIALPGFHTAAEAAAGPGADGSELFLAACALMADGTRTAILSRWTVGGDSTRQLIREAMQEMNHQPPLRAWQRAVQLLRVRRLDPRSEPRLAETAEPVPGSHPLLWSGYLLIDAGDQPSK